MKCFIIYNPNGKLSTKLVQESIESCIPFNMVPELFPGIFGNDIETTLDRELLSPSRLKEFTQGEKGCFLSHYLLWKNCVKDNEPYLILEHDIHMLRILPDNILDQFEDVCNLDLCGSLRKEYDRYLECMRKTGIASVKKLFGKISGNPSWELAKSQNVAGAHAYIVKPEGAEKLITAAKKFGFLPTDVHINGYYVNISVCDPSIFRTCDFMIDKRNRIKYSSTKGYNDGQK